MAPRQPETAPMTVLHVDDDPAFRDLTASLLGEDDDTTVESAPNVDAGLRRLREGDIDCVVSDYDMPGRDGLDFLGAVRERWPDLPFILFTGKGSEAVASEAISAGVTDYLQKGAGTDRFEVLSNRVTHAVERARAEAARRRQVSAIETAREGISILDEDYRFIYVNEAYAALYGYTPDEMRGEHWTLVYPEEDVADIRATVLPTVERDGHWHGTTRGRRADGTTFTEDHVLSLTDDGELVCIVRDVTEREEREQELRRYATLIEALDDPVYALDETGTFTYVNDAFVDLVGYDREEIVGATPALIKDDDTLATAEEHLGRLLSASGPDSLTFEVDIRHKGGDTIRCEDHIGVLPYEGDSFEGSVGVLRDITERTEREQALREERAFVEQCLDALDDVFYVFSTEGDLLRWNSRLNAVTGYDDETLAEMTPTDFFADDHTDEVAAAVEEVLTTGSARLRADYLTADGERIPHEFTGVRLTDPDGAVVGFAGIGRDITDRREYERRLERENERLAEFASIVSHDLRNPLQTAQTRLDVARETLADDDTDDGVATHLAAIDDAHERMDDLIAELLVLAKEGEIALDPQPVDIAETAASCWETVVTGTATLSLDDPPTIRADESRVRQLLSNLFGNAVTHAGPDVRITVGALASGDGFYVADDGPGIPATERGRVLESGYTTDADGIGMGLSIVARIVDAHGWELRLTDGPDGGARFEITGVDTVE